MAKRKLNIPPVGSIYESLSKERGEITSHQHGIVRARRLRDNRVFDIPETDFDWNIANGRFKVISLKFTPIKKGGKNAGNRS